MKMDDVCMEALSTFGEDAQVLKALEETGELTAALSRYHNRLQLRPLRPSFRLREQLAQEIADVTIMLHQMTLLCGPEIVEACKKQKLERLEEIIKGEKNNA